MVFKMASKDLHATKTLDPSDILKAAEIELNILLDEAAVYRQFMAANPGSSPHQARERFCTLLADLGAAINGGIQAPSSDFYPNKYLMSRIIHSPAPSAESFSSYIESLKQSLPSRQTTKNVTWSDEEHRLFLVGMDVHGKGDWKSISQNFVLSRTPSQIASHAQKYFKRLKKCQEEEPVFITKFQVSQLGYTSKNSEINYLVENPEPIAQLPITMADLSSPFFYFQ